MMDTCQRTLWVGSAGADDLHSLSYGGETFRGEEAYHFLLRVATGLESVIVGETDVFGQIKSSWRDFELKGSELVQELRPWMQKIFEDTKEIRKTFLQNLGGSSYGTLVRKWIKCSLSHRPLPQIFMVGAGQIAHSIAPFLSENEIWLSNRNEMRLKDLHQKLARSKLMLSSDDQMKAWQEATHIIVCTPFDSEMDSQRINWFLKENSQTRHILHLGGNANEKVECWQNVPQFTSLADLFDLQNRVAHLRTSQIKQADQACSTLAKERAIFRPRATQFGMTPPLGSVVDDRLSFAY